MPDAASFVVLAPVAVALIAVNGRLACGCRLAADPASMHRLCGRMAGDRRPVARPQRRLDRKWGLTEEYGSAALIERFAYRRHERAGIPAGVSLLPAGDREPVVDRAFGPEAMARFVYYTPKSFFHVGRSHRDKLVEAHGRLDPLIGGCDPRRDARALVALSAGQPAAGVVRTYGSAGYLGLALVPLFVWACVTAVRRSQPLFLLYAAPAAGDARLARRGRQPLHALQPHPDRAVFRGAAWIISGTRAAACRRYSSATPPALITFAHFSVSAAMTLPKSSGVPANQHAAELGEPRLHLRVGETRR